MAKLGMFKPARENAHGASALRAVVEAMIQIHGPCSTVTQLANHVTKANRFLFPFEKYTREDAQVRMAREAEVFKTMVGQHVQAMTYDDAYKDSVDYKPI